MNPHPRRGRFSFPLLAAAILIAAAGVRAAPATQSTASPPPAQAAAQRAPATRAAATAPTSQPTAQDLANRQKLADLMRQSFKLFNQKNYAQAEKVLKETLALAPHEPTNLYNMACVMALTHRPDEALAYLELAARSGFTDFIHIEQDPDLKSLRDLQVFKNFLGRKNEYQHKEAEAALETLRQRFGPGYLYEIDDADKLVFATNTDQTTLDALKTNLLRQAVSQWQQLFEHKPDQYIFVVVPSHADYHKIVRRMGVEGFYNHESRMLIADGLGLVTQHEFTHAMHAADLDPLGQQHPIWLTEGLAVLFERAEYEPGANGGEVLTPRDNFRLAHLQMMGRRKRLIPLPKLFAMTQPQFVNGDPMLSYAESGSILHYLYVQKLLRKFYDTYKANYDKDATGRLAIETTTGKKLDEFEKDWKVWMLARTPPPMNTGPQGPFLGVQFDQGNDGIVVRSVLPNGAAAKAGILTGDVIVGVGNMDVRDLLSFMPLLAEHKVGETLSFKLRREHEYLDIPVTLGRRTELLQPVATGPATKP